MGDELHPIQTLDGLKRLWKIGVETGRILQAAETCAATPKPPAGGGTEEDRRYELAVALFQAAHGARLVAWSDTTRDYWLKRADAALALPAPVVEVSRDMLAEVMQDAWGEICDDAAAHPSDMQHGRGTVLFYRPGHWTDLIALRLNERLAALSEGRSHG